MGALAFVITFIIGLCAMFIRPVKELFNRSDKAFSIFFVVTYCIVLLILVGVQVIKNQKAAQAQIQEMYAQQWEAYDKYLENPDAYDFVMTPPTVPRP